MAENVLGTIFSRADALKRQLYDMIRNPSDYASMVGGRTQENMAAAQALQNEAFADPQNPLRITNPQALNQLTQMITSGPLGFAPAGIVKPEMISSLKELTMSPVDDVIKQAVQNTPGAKLTETGLELPVTRYQRPVQGGRESSRSGVFYGIGDKAEIFKDVKNDMPGGTQMVSGVTKVQNPFFAVGTDLMGASIDAFKKLNPEKYKEVDEESVKIFFRTDKNNWEESIKNFFEKYAPDQKSNINKIINAHPYQKQLILIESALAQELRNKGYDSMVGVYGAGTKTFEGKTPLPEQNPTIFEIFDVREATYPRKSGKTTIRPEFLKEEPQSLLD